MTRRASWFVLLNVVNVGCLLAGAQGARRDLVVAQVDDRSMVTLAGNVRPEVTAENDRGERDRADRLEGLQMVMHRSAENQQAFESYLNDQHERGSVRFHKWLTNAQIGEMFGPSTADLGRVREWLEAKGFTVNGVSPDGMVMEFDGTVGLVDEAFHAAIHNLSVGGESHFANASDPEIPVALAPVVEGIASLNDFRPHRMSHLRTAPVKTGVVREGNGGNGYNYVSAADLATIYNFNPLFKAGITGKGQTVVVVEDTDLYSEGDWQVFRKVFGLSRAYPYGTLTQLNPKGSARCKSPGTNPDDGEAALDVEWASAAAPNAAIVNAACKDTHVQFGGFLALQNLLEREVPPSIVSVSYGEAEADLGVAENFYIELLYGIASAEGVSVYVASGDEGAASADANKRKAKHGIGVSGFTTTPFNVSVGGTDFGPDVLGTPGVYFSPKNGPNFQTALSYIPEVPWNDSCAGTLLATLLGYPSAGANSLCNSALAPAYGLLTTTAGSGGPSGCARGVPNKEGVVGGSCVGYRKPAWQRLVGVPDDGLRDTPDVSLMAGNGVLGSYYAFCFSDPAGGSGLTPCSGDPATWAGAGGTSFASPIWAGIQALVNQATGESWGNANPVLYRLARQAYGETGRPRCNSSLGNAVGANCVFYDVTQGDIAVDCKGKHDCYNSGGKFGVLSTSKKTLEPAYPASVGWDFASGIGSTNATNLVNAWTAYASGVAASQ